MPTFGHPKRSLLVMVVYALAVIMPCGLVVVVVWPPESSVPPLHPLIIDLLAHLLANILISATPFVPVAGLFLFAYRSRKAAEARKAVAEAGFKVVPGKLIVRSAYLAYSIFAFNVCYFIFGAISANIFHVRSPEFLAWVFIISLSPSGVLALALFNRCHVHVLIDFLERRKRDRTNSSKAKT